MKKMRLVVNVHAHFEWLEPPKDLSERLMREQADNMASAAAHRTNGAVQLLVLELLNAQTPNDQHNRPASAGPG